MTRDDHRTERIGLASSPTTLSLAVGDEVWEEDD